MDEFACYVPAFIQRRLSHAPEPPTELWAEQIQAAILFADISGFTPLANRLARLGPEGAEELDRLLNAYYAPLVELICSHGGDVVAYAGDAAIAIWPASTETMAEAIVRAAQCGLALQVALNQFEVDRDVRLSMKVCLAAGPLTLAHVGGVNGVWQPLVAGPAMQQIRSMEKQIRVGDVLLSAKSRDLAGQALRGELLAEGHLRIASVVMALSKSEIDSRPPMESASAALRSFVPPTVLSRIDAGHSKWLADLRQATVTFINLGGIDSREAGSIEKLQTVMQILQHEMARFEGQVVQLIEDDKGLVAIHCFGLPPLTHEDDAPRAVEAAAVVQRELAAIGLQAGTGIATGRVFCGPRGSSRRREYAITGSIVNLAARLMGKSQGGVLCDEATHKASTTRIDFETLPAIALKGISQPVSVFRPTGKRVVTRSTDGQIAGRAAELATLTETLRTAASGEPRLVMIEGEPGIGKSTLLAAFESQAQQLGFALAVGVCNAVERATPYFPWRGVLGDVLEIADIADAEERRQAVLDRLRFDPILESRASLLKAVLDVAMPDNEVVSQMSSSARADNLHELLIAILNRAAQAQPLVIIIDDAQWMDASSWRMTQLVLHRARRVTLTLAMRPLQPPEPEEYQHFLERGELCRLQLTTLPRDELRQLVVARVGGLAPTPQLLEFLYERTQGNPFFTEELLSFLEEGKLLLRRESVCDLAPWARGEGAGSVPGSVRALVTSRIDRLLPPQQMTIKTGSVIGRTFPKRTLADVYEIPQDVVHLDEHLAQARHINLIDIESQQPDLTYLFRHSTIQQVVYDQIPRQNRRRLHSAIAQWYEREFGGTFTHWRLLAHHWGQADEAEKEVEYLVKSGENALLNFANREAVESFQAALDRQLEASRGNLSAEQRRRRAHWERQLGEAHFHVGNLPEAQLHLEQALVLMERPAPGGKWSVLSGLAGQILIQSVHSLFPRWFTNSRLVDTSEDSAAGLHESALALQRLSQLHYLTVEMPLGLNRALRALNAAERAGKSALLARAYAGLCLVTGMLRFHRTAQRYARLAEQTARESGNLPMLAYGLMVTCVYRLGLGEWDRVRTDAKESVAIAERLGDLHQLGDSITVEAMLQCFLGDDDAALATYERIAEVAHRSENVLHQGWAVSGRGECLFRLGRLEEASACFHKTLEMLADMEHRTEDIRMNGMLAAAYWRLGNEAQSIQHAERTIKIIEQGSYATVSTLEGFSGVAEVYLERWARDVTSAESRRAAEVACQKLRWYAKVYAIGKPRWLCFEGQRLHILGRHTAAQQCWTRAQDEARRLSMSLEQALAQKMLGRYS